MAKRISEAHRSRGFPIGDSDHAGDELEDERGVEASL